MIKMRGAQQPAIMLCIRSLMWTLTCAAFLFFFWALFARPTDWYGDDTSGHFGKMWHGMTVPLRALQKQVKNVDSPVMGGENNSMVSVSSPHSKASRCSLWSRQLDLCTGISRDCALPGVAGVNMTGPCINSVSASTHSC